MLPLTCKMIKLHVEVTIVSENFMIQAAPFSPIPHFRDENEIKSEYHVDKYILYSNNLKTEEPAMKKEYLHTI